MKTETIGLATLYFADCLTVLPGMRADAVITDPPYGIGDRMQGGTWGAAEKYADFREWDKAPTDEALALVRSVAPTTVIWGGNYFSLPPSRCWLIWDKYNAVPTMADIEMAWTNMDKPGKRFRWQVGAHASGHPTEKPVELMRWCVERAGLPRHRAYAGVDLRAALSAHEGGALQAGAEGHAAARAAAGCRRSLTARSSTERAPGSGPGGSGFESRRAGQPGAANSYRSDQL